jgi:hypothetical protein
VVGESGASPIPLSSPTRRQSSLSPNAYTQHMVTSHVLTHTTTSTTNSTAGRPQSNTRHAAFAASPSQTRPPLNPVSDLEEEIKIVEMIFTTLSSSLAYYEHGGSSVSSTYVPTGEVATPSDAKNFISHFNAVITYAVAHSGLQERTSVFGAHGAFSAEAALIRLVFDCPFDVIQIMTNLVQSAYRNAFVPPRSGHNLPPLQEQNPSSAQQQQVFRSNGKNHSIANLTTASVVSVAEDFVALRLAAIEALKQLLNVAIEATSRKKPSTLSTSTGGTKNPSSVLDMIQTSFSRCGTIKVLLDVVLLPTAPEVLRVAAVETIFVFMMRCIPSAVDARKNDGVSQQNSALRSILTSSFDALLKAVAMDASDKVRCYTAAVIRQLISLFPRHSNVVKSVPVLLRAMAQESQHDVVALCAASVDMIVRRAALELDHAAVAGGIQNVVDTSCQLLEKVCGSYSVVLRLQPPASYANHGDRPQQNSILKHSATSDEDDKQYDVLESLSGLLHACVLFALSAVSADLQSVFRGMLLQGAIPRLAKLCRVQHIGCARVAAACLCLMVLRAPPSFAIPLALSEPRAAVHIVHGVVSKAMPAGPISMEEDEALRQSTALYLFDIAVSVAASIVFAPLARAHWRKLLSELPTWEAPFVQRLSAALAGAELALFADIIVQDECGVSLNEVAAVEWDDDAHPSPHSIQCLLDAQEVRRVAKNGSLASSLSHWRSVEQARRRPDTKRGYLCFVVLGYAFIILGDPVPVLPTVVTLEGGWKQSGIAAQESSEELGAPAPNAIPSARHAGTPLQSYDSHSSHVHRPLFPHVASPIPTAQKLNSQQKLQRPAAQPPQAPNESHLTAPLAQRSASRINPKPQQPQDDMYRHLYKEFQAALELTIFLSTHYHRNRLTASEITGGGPVPPPSIAKLASSKCPAANPYAKKAPLANGDRAQQMRAWTSSVVEEGDLFFFYIPLSALSVNVVEAVIGKARKHQVVAKKHFLITPQHQKARRWFLLDMHTAIMPKLIVLLQSLKKLIAVHTEESVRNALQVLPSIHVRRAGGGAPPPTTGGAAAQDAAVDKAITCSNLRSVCDFALQTFSIRMTSSAVDDIFGSFAGAGGNGSGVMASSFFAPLFPPGGNSAFLEAAEGAQREQRHGQHEELFPSRGDSLSTHSGFDDEGDEDVDEMEMFRDAVPQQRAAGGGASYSIRRMSAVGGSTSVPPALDGRRPLTTAASTSYGGNDEDDDDSFELMKF